MCQGCVCGTELAILGIPFIGWALHKCAMLIHKLSRRKGMGPLKKLLAFKWSDWAIVIAMIVYFLFIYLTEVKQ